MSDYYHILGISKNAAPDEVKKAYRKLAHQYHPDKQNGDKTTEKRFKEVNEAYEILSDEKKRAYYDQFGSAPSGGGSGGGDAGGFGGAGGFGQGFDFSQFSNSFGGDFEDIFKGFFGGGGGGGKSGKKKRGPRRGEDIETTLKISFEEAIFGTEKELIFDKTFSCEHCKGKGMEPDSKLVDCKTCHGTGEIRSVRQTILGQMMTSRVCDTCDGEGHYPEKKCSRCHGMGRVRKTEHVTVKIPAGIDQGATLRLSEKGEAGVFGATAGDLYVHLNIASSKIFIRDGADIHTEQKIHLLQAVLGDTISVKTVHGPVQLKIPAGTQSGRVFQLKEYGIQRLQRSSRGDHYVKIIVEIPEKISKKERALYEQLVREASDHRSESAQDAEDGFFKNLFS